MKRLLNIFLLLCIVGLFFPAFDASANTNVKLYSVINKEVHGQPYRLTKGGDIVGNVPSHTILEVITIEGDWAKVKYKGADYYMWAAKLQKVNAPHIVVSPWAKKWFAHFDGTYYGIAGEWKHAKEDWTKPITRNDMAEILVRDIMEGIYDEWPVQFVLPGAFKGADELRFSDAKDYNSGRLLYWGIVPEGKFNGKKQITYGEYTELLLKLMAYDKKMNREGGGQTFTKKDIEQFAIGGNIKSDANITMEQAKIMAQKTILWWDAMNLLTVVKSDQAKPTKRGSNLVGTGVYSIRAFIGTKPNLVIKEGKGELKNGTKQSFQVTYKNTYPNMLLYTIQTMDGKYLALSNGTKNGNRLITQQKEYIWAIQPEGSLDQQYTQSIYAPINQNQKLNASAWKTEDGTHVITWFVESDVPNNAKWLFDYVGPISGKK